MNGMRVGKSTGIFFALMVALLPASATAGYQYKATPYQSPLAAAPVIRHFAPRSTRHESAPEDMSKLAPVFSDLEDEFPAPIGLLVPPLVMASPAQDGTPVIVAPEAVAAKVAAKKRTPELSGLPATVKISPGQLVINWRNADDLLAQLEKVSQAAAEDSAPLEAMMHKEKIRKDQPRDVATEALRVGENEGLPATIAGLLATSVNPLIGQRGLISAKAD